MTIRLWLSRLAGILALVAGQSTGTARGEVNLAPPAPLPTSLTFFSTPGEMLGQGQTRIYTPADGSFSLGYYSRLAPNWVEIAYWGHNSEFWYTIFKAPDTAALAVGDYENAVRASFAGPGQAGVEFIWDGGAWNTLQGSFQILQADFGSDGSVLHFAADFVQRGDGSPLPLYGRVRYNATVPRADQPLTADPRCAYNNKTQCSRAAFQSDAVDLVSCARNRSTRNAAGFS